MSAFHGLKRLWKAFFWFNQLVRKTRSPCSSASRLSKGAPKNGAERRQMRVKSFLGMVLIVILLAAVIVIPVAAQAPEVAASPVTEVAVAVPAELIMELVVGAAALMWFITGAVTYIKKLGVRGKWLTVSAMVLGIGIGGAYKVLLTPPVTALDWFLAALYGFGCGLIATGVYDSYGKPTGAVDGSGS